MNRIRMVGILSVACALMMGTLGCGDGSAEPGSQDAGQDVGQDAGKDMGQPTERVVFGVAEVGSGAIGSSPPGSLHSVDALCNNFGTQHDGLPDAGWAAVFGNRVESAVERLGEVEGPVYNTAGEVVVPADGTLFGTDALQAPILDRDGESFAEDTYFWTGSNADGTLADGEPDEATCSGWTVSESAASGVAGDGSTTDTGWLSGQAQSCDQELGLYCISR